MLNRAIPLIPALAILITVGAMATPSRKPPAPLGADHPAHAVNNDGWPKGYAALINADNRVHGYWVNFEDVFFLKGDGADLSKFIKACSTFADVDVEVVLHPGRLAVQSPWDESPREIEADWRSYTSPFKIVGEGTQRTIGEKRFQIVIDVWLGGRVKLEDLDIPVGVPVRSGGEIEAFIEQHNARRSDG